MSRLIPWGGRGLHKNCLDIINEFKYIMVKKENIIYKIKKSKNDKKIRIKLARDRERRWREKNDQVQNLFEP
jgi:hypothetical protein